MNRKQKCYLELRLSYVNIYTLRYSKFDHIQLSRLFYQTFRAVEILIVISDI